MLSGKLRGWDSYFSKKVDDTFGSLIPNPPQSNQQETVQLEANPQEEARRRGQQLAENCTRPVWRIIYAYWVFLIIILVVVFFPLLSPHRKLR